MKPSTIKTVRAKKAFLLFPGFRGLTWKGVVYCRNKYDINMINATDTITSDFECHETLHVRQAEYTNDSWLVFYTMYLWQWICNFPLFIAGWMVPYKFIPFELEAFANEENHDYPTHGPVSQWEKYNELTIKQKLAFARDYNKQKGKVTFKNYVRKNITPAII